ncbi:hypothetical protein FRC03_005890 [Tulasnella sp. 419]|nr:hypothetical protein FRC03_005890 [Tulasnella sp. 419]
MSMILNRLQLLPIENDRQDGLIGRGFAKSKEALKGDDIKHELSQIRHNVHSCHKNLLSKSNIRTEATVHAVYQMLAQRLIIQPTPGSESSQMNILQENEQKTRDQLSTNGANGTSGMQVNQNGAHVESHVDRAPSIKSAKASIKSVSSSFLERDYLRRKTKDLKVAYLQHQDQTSRSQKSSWFTLFRNSNIAVWEEDPPRFRSKEDSSRETLRVLDILRSGRNLSAVEVAKLFLGLAQALKDSGEHEARGAIIALGVQNCYELTKSSNAKILISFIEFVYKEFTEIAIHGRTEDAKILLDCGVKVRRRLEEQDERDYVFKLASFLSNTSDELKRMGQLDARMHISKEVVEIRRNAVQFDRETHLPDLAKSLHQLALCLVEVHRYSDGVNAAIEVLRLSKELAEGFPGQHLRNLITSLFEFLNRLEENYQDGVKAGQVATAGYIPDLSILSQLALQLDKEGNHEAAAKIGEAILKMHRDLMQEDSKVNFSEFTDAIRPLWSFLKDKGGHGGAALRGREAVVGVAREAAKRDPARNVSKLILSLRYLGRELSQSGSHEEAERMGREAVALGRQLVQIDRERNLLTLSATLHQLGGFLSEAGLHDEAVKVGKESVIMGRELVKREEAESHLFDLAVSLCDLGFALRCLELRNEAKETGEESVKILRGLVQKDRKKYLSNLGSSLNHLQFHFGAVKQFEEGVKIGLEVVEIRRELIQTDRKAHLPDLSQSLRNLAHGYAETGRYEDAVTIGEEGVKLDEELVQRDRESHLQDLGISLHKLAFYFSSTGRHEDAVRAEEDAVEICRELVKRGPKAHLSELRKRLKKLAFFLKQMGRYEEADIVEAEVVELSRRAF